MTLESVLGESISELGLRFILVGILPLATLVLFILVLVWSGAPGNEPQLSLILEKIKELKATESVFLILAIIIFSLILQPLQLSLVRRLEGYWGDSRFGDFLSQLGIRMQKIRRHKLEEDSRIIIQKNEAVDISLVERAHMNLAAWKLRQFYPAENRLLPTTLGNVLRAAEDMPKKQYGLDAVVIWPRLYPLLSDELKSILADRRNQLDIAARFCAVFLLITIISTAFLFRHGWWLTIPASALLISWLSYKAAIAAALAYGESILIAFDLHRFDLLKALHFSLPSNRDSEKQANQRLSDFLGQGLPMKYLFSWDNIPGNDNGRLIDFLKQDYSIDWVKKAKIEKIDGSKTIRLSIEKNYLSLSLNDEKTKVNLKIDDCRTDEFITKMENGKLNIYPMYFQYEHY